MNPPESSTVARPLRLVVSDFPGEGGPLGDEVRVWVVPFNAVPLDASELLGFLTPDEQTRAARYKVEKARHEFVIARGLLRSLLGTHLGMVPNTVPIVYNGGGKPGLSDAVGSLHFNVTHTDGLALIALASRPVGIDVERVRTLANPDGLVGRFFSPAEATAYRALPAELQMAGFFRGWTTKEAVIKAAGLTVLCLDGFDVELHPARLPAVLAVRHAMLCASEWRLHAWEPVPGFAAAVCLESEIAPNTG